MRAIAILAKAHTIFFVMPLLMIIMILGTVAQRYIGLHEAEKLFFTSWVIWIGPLPVPGMYPLIGIIALGLCAKLALYSPWCKAQAGIIIAHAGVLLLLLGGLLTALTSEEGFIMLREGEMTRSVADYHARELAIIKNNVSLLQVPLAALHDGLELHHEAIPFALRIESFCRNCTPSARAEQDPHYKDLAAKLIMTPAPLQPQDEDNQAGVMVAVSGVDAQQDGVYLSHEVMPRKPSIVVGDDTFSIALRKVPRDLPFEVTLNHLSKQTHPGTDMAREYQSDITVKEQSGITWPASIRMNEPLRTHGYTLYQSSFVETQGAKFSVLAVVKNKGWLFPYMSSMLIAIGLIIHAAICLSRQPKQATT